MSSVEEWERFTSLGEKLGYSGVELRKWVTEQVKLAAEKGKADQEREVRRLEREAQQQEIAAKAKLELEERQAMQEERQAKQQAEVALKQQQWEREKLEREEVELQKQQQWEQQKIEREEALKQLELQQKREEIESHERIKMRELELEQERLAKKVREAEEDDAEGSDGANSHGSDTSSVKRRSRAGPKLPHFDDTKDNVDSYLRRFERYAELQAWPKDEWAINLSALLKGNALEVYSRLSEAESKSYDKLKSALLRKYDMTVDGFRKRFYEARRERDETAAQFVCRIVGYLDRWVQLAHIEHSFEGLKQLIVKEQFLAVSEEELALYLRERSPQGLDELVNLADLYLEARHKPKIGQKDFRKRDKTYGKFRFDKRHPEEDSKMQSKYNADKRPSTTEAKSERVCYSCGKSGHIKRFCPHARSKDRSGGVDMVASCQVVRNQPIVGCQHDSGCSGTLKLECGCELPYVGCLTVRSDNMVSSLPIAAGKANGVDVSVLRDTGCTTIVIRRSLVRDDQLTGNYRYYRMLDGTVKKAEMAVVDIETPYLSGKLPCLCIETPTCDVIVGNVSAESSTVETEEVNAVTTRAKALTEGKPPRPMVVPTFKDLQVTVANMQQLQQESDDLQKWFDHAKSGKIVPSGKTASVKFITEHGLLYRVYQTEQGRETKQLAVPTSLRRGVLSLAHDSIMSGHLGVKKTLDRVLSNFSWPGVASDVTRHCRSCDVCQRTLHKGRVTKAPLQSMPIIGVPFQRVGIDLIGPITPASSSGCRFVLTVADYATRYPEAVALKGISTQEVAEALCKIFSRVGVPTQVVSDQGTQFVSDVMKEVYRLLSIQHLTSTPYHPQCNGLVERFNGTLKSMLKKLCVERPTDWDRYLEAVLFAYREVKQESLGFSPFELLYGRTVRGPMAILRELWTNDIPEEEQQSTYQYVFELRNKLEDTCKLVEQSLKESQVKSKSHFDRKARMRQLKAGDKVLILLPTDSHKLLMQWKGPFEVIERVGVADYKVKLESGAKVFHINMLKQYFSRDDGNQKRPSMEADEVAEVAAAVLEDETNDPLKVHFPGRAECDNETIYDIHVCSDLTERQKKEHWIRRRAATRVSRRHISSCIPQQKVEPSRIKLFRGRTRVFGSGMGY